MAAAQYTSIFGSLSPAPQASPSGTSQGTPTPETTLPIVFSGNVNQSPQNTDPEKPPICRKAPKLEDVEKTIVDSHGDLFLQVGEIRCVPSSVVSNHTHTDAQEFLVDSKALSRASPVFRKMLFGTFSESEKPDLPDNWFVKLPDDNVAAMSTLLHIMHCRFDKVPPVHYEIPLDDLYQIAILTDKYDCTALVRPWARAWLASMDTYYSSNATIPMLERISWIAWEYGDKDLFEKAARSLVLNLTLPEEGVFGTPAPPSAFFTSTLEPHGLKDLVHSRRQAAIGDLLTPVQTAVSKLTRPLPKQGDLFRSYTCSATESVRVQRNDKIDCDAIMLGRLVQTLATINLWPLPFPRIPTSYRSSVSNLQKNLVLLSDIKGSPSGLHAGCSPLANLTRTIITVTNGMTSLSTDSQLRHLAAQAKKSGISE